MAIILITGCSTGIGFAATEALARSGHTVFATMRNPQRAPELGRLAQQERLPITVLPMDVDSNESVRSAVATVLSQVEIFQAIITGERSTFRNPVGADAAPFLGWWASTSDEDWITIRSLDEETWIAGMEQMGLEVRPYLNRPNPEMYNSPSYSLQFS